VLIILPSVVLRRQIESLLSENSLYDIPELFLFIMPEKMKKLTVIAFGGNALLRGDQVGTIDEQEQNVYETCQHLGSIDQGRIMILLLVTAMGPRLVTYLLAA
jgi:hypothetical protein